MRETGAINPYQPFDDKQEDLFTVEEDWREEWVGMPEFEQEKLEAFATITIRVGSQEDLDELSSLLGQKLTQKTKSIWHPQLTRGFHGGRRWRSES